MSLKILILPIFIILEVIIAIGYVKPNVDSILAKREEIAAAKEALTRVDTVVGNIQSIGRLLKNQSEAVGFIEKYYPMKLDEERAIDMFNYFAQQTGIIVTEIETERVPGGGGSSFDTVYNEALNNGLTPEEATLKAQSAALAIPDSYTVEVTTLGNYQNLKNFMNKIYRSDRLHNVQMFSVILREETPNEVEDEPAAGTQERILIGALKAEFSYVGKQKASDILNNSLFQSPTFDFKIAEEAMAFVMNPLPVLDAGVTGRANPYE